MGSSRAWPSRHECLQSYLFNNFFQSRQPIKVIKTNLINISSSWNPGTPDTASHINMCLLAMYRCIVFKSGRPTPFQCCDKSPNIVIAHNLTLCQLHPGLWPPAQASIFKSLIGDSRSGPGRHISYHSLRIKIGCYKDHSAGISLSLNFNQMSIDTLDTLILGLFEKFPVTPFQSMQRLEDI